MVRRKSEVIHACLLFQPQLNNSDRFLFWMLHSILFLLSSVNSRFTFESEIGSRKIKNKNIPSRFSDTQNTIRTIARLKCIKHNFHWFSRQNLHLSSVLLFQTDHKSQNKLGLALVGDLAWGGYGNKKKTTLLLVPLYYNYGTSSDACISE